MTTQDIAVTTKPAFTASDAIASIHKTIEAGIAECEATMPALIEPSDVWCVEKSRIHMFDIALDHLDRAIAVADGDAIKALGIFIAWCQGETQRRARSYVVSLTPINAAGMMDYEAINKALGKSTAMGDIYRLARLAWTLTTAA